MAKSKIPLPPSKGEYKCKAVRGYIHQFDAYCGKYWIGSLMNCYAPEGWGISKTQFIVESASSRLICKSDLLYLIECIDFLNSKAANLDDH